MSHRIQKKDAHAHAARLAEQLRANLRRRKAQAREVGAEQGDNADAPTQLVDDPPAKADESDVRPD